MLHIVFYLHCSNIKCYVDTTDDTIRRAMIMNDTDYVDDTK